MSHRQDLGAMAMKGYSAFPKVPALLKLQRQIVLCHIQDTCWAVGLTPPQRSSRCNLKPQPTGPEDGRDRFIHQLSVNRKQPCPGFELKSVIAFLTKITVMLKTPLCLYVLTGENFLLSTFFELLLPQHRLQLFIINVSIGSCNVFSEHE